MLYNAERLLSLMDRFGLDALVATTPENILYLSGLSSWSQNAYRYGNSQPFVVHPRNPSQPPAIIVPGGDVGYAALDEVWVKEVYTYGRPRKPHRAAEGAQLSPEEARFVSVSEALPKGLGPAEAVAQVIREKGLEHGQIGLDHFGLPGSTVDSLSTLLPNAKLHRAGNFFRYVRMIKSPEEIQRLREAAIINDRAVRSLLRKAEAGTSEAELAAAYRSEVGKAGGQVYWLHMSAGRAGNFPPLKDRTLERGDVLRVDMGCSVRGYHADTCRSGSVGEPTAKHRKMYDAVRAGVLKAVDLLKPSVLPSTLFETMIEGVRSAGIADYSNFFVGHTIGLEAREFPFILGPAEELSDPFLPSTTDIPLEPGMVVNLEASSHQVGWGTVQVEYTLLVTEAGSEFLIPPEQELYSLPVV